MRERGEGIALQPVVIPPSRAVAQHVGLQVVTKGLLLAQTVVIARLYGPEQLGALALLLLVVNGFGTAVSPGLDRYLLQSEVKGFQKRLDAAFTLSGAAALGALVLLWVASPIMLALFGAGRYASQLRLLSLALLAQTLLLPAVAWERELRLVKANLPAMLAPFAFSSIAAVAAWTGKADIHSLVLAQLGSLAATALVVWAAAPHRPRVSRDPKVLREAIAFGMPLLAAGFLGFLIAQGDDLLVRYYNDDRALGLYTVAFYLPAQLLALVDVIGRVAVSAMADLRGSQQALKDAFAEFSGYIAILTVGFGMALVLVAEPLVLLLYGEDWLPIVSLVRLFSLAFLIRGVTGFHWQALAVLFGRTGYILRASLLSVLFLAITAPPLIWYFGLYGGALYSVAQLAVMGPLIRFPLIKELLGDLSFIRTAVRPLVTGTVALLLGLLVLTLVPDSRFNAVLAVIIFGATYVALLARYEPLLAHAFRGITDL